MSCKRTRSVRPREHSGFALVSRPNRLSQNAFGAERHLGFCLRRPLFRAILRQPANRCYSDIACCGEPQEVSPRPVPDGRGARASRIWGSDDPDGRQDRGDPSAPLSGPDPAPGCHVRKRQQHFLMCAQVLVVECLPLASSSYRFDQALVVMADEGRILLEYEAGVAAGAGNVSNYRVEARRACFPVGAIAAPGVVDNPETSVRPTTKEKRNSRSPVVPGIYPPNRRSVATTGA